MGAMNWLAAGLATLAAAGVVCVLRRGTRVLTALAGALVSAAMLGHALARIGPDKLAVKPWLYFMQSGGLALAFVIPALWVSQLRHGVSPGETARDSAVWLLGYLAMGAVFCVAG